MNGHHNDNNYSKLFFFIFLKRSVLKEIYFSFYRCVFVTQMMSLGQRHSQNFNQNMGKEMQCFKHVT